MNLQPSDLDRVACSRLRVSRFCSSPRSFNLPRSRFSSWCPDSHARTPHEHTPQTDDERGRRTRTKKTRRQTLITAPWCEFFGETDVCGRISRTEAFAITTESRAAKALKELAAAAAWVGHYSMGHTGTIVPCKWGAAFEL